MSRYAENEKELPILAPADITATATNTQYVDLNYAAGLVEIALAFGVITSTDTPFGATVTLTTNNIADTSSSDSVETAIAFQYRLSAAVGTDTMGDLTAATTAGVLVADASDNCTLYAFVEPAAVAASAAGARFLRATITPAGNTAACVVGASARFIPRFAQKDIPSST